MWDILTLVSRDYKVWLFCLVSFCEFTGHSLSNFFPTYVHLMSCVLKFDIDDLLIVADLLQPLDMIQQSLYFL